MQLFWPIALVIIANTLYQLCAKSIPNTAHPLAAVSIAYMVSAVFSIILYLILNRGNSYFHELSHINWSSFAMGITIVGLEVGFIYAYKVGWSVGTASTTANAVLAVTLLIVGALVYKDVITPSKIIGIVICLIGIYLINK